MDQIRTILSRTPLFGGLAEAQLDRIKTIAKEKSCTKGEAIFMEGDHGNGFYVILDGMVKVFKVSAEGKEQILHIYGPGQPIGEVPVFSGQHFPANAEAVQQSRLLFFPRQAFIDLITREPSLALNMLAVLSMRLRQFTVQIENLSLKEVPGRLASYLIYLTGEQATPDTVMLPISKGQLASLLGTIPETLSRIFNKMTNEGIIAVQGAAITIRDARALEELAVSGRLGG